MGTGNKLIFYYSVEKNKVGIRQPVVREDPDKLQYILRFVQEVAAAL
jgi:hypothetical protein